jgi:dihydrolipoamide dehydrogenase
MKFDCIVIGGGPGGYVAAIRGSQKGLNVALVEEKHLGGVCLNWGCIPTKALLKSAQVYADMKKAADFGVNVENVTFDLKKMVERSRNVSGQLACGVKGLLKKNKVTIFDGRGRLIGNGKVQVGEQILEAKNIIIATGARAKSLPHIVSDGKIIWSAADAMVPDHVPQKLLVLGSGAIGIEFASFFNALGAQVTVVELQMQILPQEDAQIAQMARKSFEGKGIRILTSSTVEAVSLKDGSLGATIKTPEETLHETFDRMILAVGITGNIEDLGLDKTKVKTDRGFIQTGDFALTGEPGVYAIGDVASPPWLAHKASHEGILAIEHMTNTPHIKPLNSKNIPGCTYSSPQIASIGLTQKQALDAGLKIKVGTFSGLGNGKALAIGSPESFVKVIFDHRTGELLGAHLIGSEVTEMIHSFALAKTLETTEADMMHTVFPHPTLSEMIHEAVLNSQGLTIHM